MSNEYPPRLKTPGDIVAEKNHQAAGHLATILTTKSGTEFLKYLFESFEVGEAPPMGLKGDDLIEFVSRQRVGNSIYKLAMAANPKLTGAILAQLEEEKLYVIKNDQLEAE